MIHEGARSSAKGDGLVGWRRIVLQESKDRKDCEDGRGGAGKAVLVGVSDDHHHPIDDFEESGFLH